VVRDLSGAVPLLEPHCPRRGTSLEFAPVDAKGVRCCYHGWRLAVDGTILETPGEPAESTLKDRLCHGAYPVHESHGIVFAYIGPPDRQPPSPVSAPRIAAPPCSEKRSVAAFTAFAPIAIPRSLPRAWGRHPYILQ
jgi:phenylpropionate dioxygenase-like ring-hydroxylating dioxygenase large terminal subunit